MTMILLGKSRQSGRGSELTLVVSTP
jgi:hypothetical protein